MELFGVFLTDQYPAILANWSSASNALMVCVYVGWCSPGN